MKISAENIEQFKTECGHSPCSLAELKDIYKSLNRPAANAVKVRDDYFISFKSAEKIQFKITDQINLDKLGFIENLNFVDATAMEKGFWKFIFYEFWQGKSGWDKSMRLIGTSLPLVILNVFALMYSSEKAIASVFAGMLTAVSIFIAIFSLFTVGQAHIGRKKPTLFKSGKLAYYFSVDKNITYLGVAIIIISLLATLLVKDGSGIFWKSWVNIWNWLILVSLNATFFGTWILLRSLVEFYIHRPAQFILGDMKKEFLENFKRI